MMSYSYRLQRQQLLQLYETNFVVTANSSHCHSSNRTPSMHKQKLAGLRVHDDGFRFSRFWPRLRIRRIHRPLRTACSIRRVPLLHLEVPLNPRCTHQLQQQPGQTLSAPTAFAPACTTRFHQSSKSELMKSCFNGKKRNVVEYINCQDVAIILSLHRVHRMQSCECN